VELPGIEPAAKVTLTAQGISDRTRTVDVRPYPRYTSSTFDKNRTLEQRRQAVANVFDFLVKGGVADTTRMPSEVIDEGHKCTLRRYRGHVRHRVDHA
jgi:hypothetical protein